MKNDRGVWLWNLMAFFYDQFFSVFPPYQKLLKSILECLQDSSPDIRILDAGCGTGLISSAIAKHKFTVVGVDRSEEMLLQAEKKKNQNNLPNLLFYKRDLNQDLDIPGGPFSKILLIHSLYLFENPKKSLKEFARHFSPRGELILCIPARSISKEELFRGGLTYLIEIIKEKGMLSFFAFLPIMGCMGILNLVIQHQKKKKVFHCWQKDEIVFLLEECGYKLNWIRESCIADSHLLISATRT